MDQAPGLLCVHAHPDDEAIMTGGILARYADEGLRTAVVTCTGGELGEVAGQDVDTAEVTAPLDAVRYDELRDALAILGAGRPRMLGYRDSGMAGDAGNANPAAFWQAHFDEAVGRLVSHLRAFRPAVVVTYDAFGVYGHPDHIQAHRVTVAAVEAAAAALLYVDTGDPWRVDKLYLATLPRSAVAVVNRELAARGLASPFGHDTDPDRVAFGTDDDEVTTTIDVRAWSARKQQALRAHRSQLAPDSLFLNIPDSLVEQVFGTEWFVRYRSRVAAPAPEDDLFAGVRPARP